MWRCSSPVYAILTTRTNGWKRRVWPAMSTWCFLRLSPNGIGFATSLGSTRRWKNAAFRCLTPANLDAGRLQKAEVRTPIRIEISRLTSHRALSMTSAGCVNLTAGANRAHARPRKYRRGWMQGIGRNESRPRRQREFEACGVRTAQSNPERWARLRKARAQLIAEGRVRGQDDGVRTRAEMAA